jgi:hypothetical protein
MPPKWMVPLAAALAWLAALAPAGAQRLPTIDEAKEMSQKTGRPIFALAGTET